MNDHDYFLKIKTEYKLRQENLSPRERQECLWVLEEIDNFYKKEENNEVRIQN